MQRKFDDLIRQKQELENKISLLQNKQRELERTIDGNNLEIVHLNKIVAEAEKVKILINELKDRIQRLTEENEQLRNRGDFDKLRRELEEAQRKVEVLIN